MQHARMQMSDGAQISGDGRYPNRRNSSHCSVDFIDNSTKKVVAIGLADKKSSYHEEDGVEMSSNMLESVCFEKAVSQMDNLAKVSLFAIDGDNKNKKFFFTSRYSKINMQRSGSS